MKIKIHHLNKDGKKIGIKELDINKYSKIGRTGQGLFFQPKKGKGFEASGYWIFEDIQKLQKDNDKAVEKKYYTYARINENESDSLKNRKRDEKGKPIRIYEKPENLYKEYGVSKWWFIDTDEWDKTIALAKINNIPILYYDMGEWIGE